MHTYKTLNELETESHSMPLDHVMNHPFFAKKSSLQEKDMTKPKEGDGHLHSSEQMNKYKSEHEKNGMDVTKAKPKKRPLENNDSVAVANKQSSSDSYGESFDIEESCGCEDVSAKVDGRTKSYRETYTRIMNRLGKLREKAKKNNMEQYGEEN